MHQCSLLHVDHACVRIYVSQLNMKQTVMANATNVSIRVNYSEAALTFFIAGNCLAESTRASISTSTITFQFKSPETMRRRPSIRYDFVFSRGRYSVLGPVILMHTVIPCKLHLYIAETWYATF